MDESDAFGAMVGDHYAGVDVVEIVERDDGWIGPNSVEGYFADPEDWPEIVRSALDRVEGRVLDVGCGPGSHALYLQEHGHDVTGIDISPGAIEVARDRGVEDVRERETSPAWPTPSISPSCTRSSTTPRPTR